jgi:hypothetical protein
MTSAGSSVSLASASSSSRLVTVRSVCWITVPAEISRAAVISLSLEGVALWWLAVPHPNKTTSKGAIHSVFMAPESLPLKGTAKCWPTSHRRKRKSLAWLPAHRCRMAARLLNPCATSSSNYRDLAAALRCRSVFVGHRSNAPSLARNTLAHVGKSADAWVGIGWTFYDAAGWSWLRARRMGIVSPEELGACARDFVDGDRSRRASTEALDGRFRCSGSLVRIQDRDPGRISLVPRASTERHRRLHTNKPRIIGFSRIKVANALSVMIREIHSAFLTGALFPVVSLPRACSRRRSSCPPSYRHRPRRDLHGAHRRRGS